MPQAIARKRARRALPFVLFVTTGVEASQFVLPSAANDGTVAIAQPAIWREGVGELGCVEISEDLRLTPQQFHITQEAGTERPFTGEYWDTTDPGTYHCIVCDEQLFDSDTKFDAHCGWPSFYESLGTDKIEYIEDRSLGMVRTEVRCAKCHAHLGHVFPDGPPPPDDGN